MLGKVRGILGSYYKSENYFNSSRVEKAKTETHHAHPAVNRVTPEKNSLHH